MIGEAMAIADHISYSRSFMHSLKQKNGVREGSDCIGVRAAAAASVGRLQLGADVGVFGIVEHDFDEFAFLSLVEVVAGDVVLANQHANRLCSEGGKLFSQGLFALLLVHDERIEGAVHQTVFDGVN
jgi:hypothetical protein